MYNSNCSIAIHNSNCEYAFLKLICNFYIILGRDNFETNVSLLYEDDISLREMEMSYIH